jgi:hypothetical protein
MAALAFSSTARYMVYGLYACNERYSSEMRSTQETEMQQLALSGIYDVTHGVWKLARHILDTIAVAEELGEELMPTPLICHCLYLAAGECEWFVLEDKDSDGAAWLRDIVELLGNIKKRWHIAGQYREFIPSLSN